MRHARSLIAAAVIIGVSAAGPTEWADNAATRSEA